MSDDPTTNADPAGLPLFTTRPDTSARALAGPPQRTSTPHEAVTVPQQPAGPPPNPPTPSVPSRGGDAPDAPDAATTDDNRSADSIDWARAATIQALVVDRFTNASRDGQTERALTYELHADEIRGYITQEVEDYSARETLEGREPIAWAERDALSKAVFDSIFGLGRIQSLIDLPLVENIDIDAHDRVSTTFADGRIEYHPPVAASDQELIQMIQQIARTAGTREKDFSPARPKLRMALPDGSRFAADGWYCPTSVSIRVHRYPDADLDKMMALGAIDEGMKAFLAAAIRAGKSMVISGLPASGKTTLIRAILNELDPSVRIATIESMYELGLHHDYERHPRVWPAEAIPPGEGDSHGVTLIDLVQAALQKNTDRLVIGEVVGDEIGAMLQAMQGGQGSISTVHANSAKDTISRMVTLVTSAKPNLSTEDAQRLVAQHVNLIVHVGLVDETDIGGRKHRFVDEIVALDVSDDGPTAYEMEYLWRPGPDERATPTGTRPTWLKELRRRGFDARYLTEGYSTWTEPLELLVSDDEEDAA